MWKSCTTAFFTGLDPPIALHPATALGPLVTPAADATDDPPKAKPSASAPQLPEKTAKPAAQQVPPTTNTAVPSAAKNDPVQKDGESSFPDTIDPGTSNGNSNSENANDDVLSASGKMEVPSKGEATVPTSTTAPQAQPATDKGSSRPPENVLPKEDNSSQGDPSKVDSSNGDSDPGLGPDLSSAVFPTEVEKSQPPRPIATAGGEPIVAVSQQLSFEGNHQSSPEFDGGSGFDSPHGNNDDQQNTGTLDPPNHTGVFDSQTEHSAAGETSISIDSAGIPVPFTTTMDGHVIQALPSPSAILVNGDSVTLGQGFISISGTPIALQQDGDLVLGSSTVQNLLPSLLPTYDSLLDLSAQTLTASDALSNQATYPTHGPEVYRIGAARITAGGPPITYAGTKVQAISDGAVIVGDMTYQALPAPAAVETAGGARYPVILDSSIRNVLSSSGAGGAGNSTGSKSEDAKNMSLASVVPFHGSGTRRRASWSVLCGVILAGFIR